MTTVLAFVVAMASILMIAILAVGVKKGSYEKIEEGLKVASVINMLVLLPSSLILAVAVIAS